MSENSEQEREWQILHDRIVNVVERFGRRDAFEDGDHWLLDDNWGRYRQELEVQNLKLLQPHIIKSLRRIAQS
jgi:hypothetical protein